MIFTRHDHKLIAHALQEDLGKPARDATVEVLFGKEKRFKRIQHARIISKATQGIVICGLQVVRALFQKLSASSRVQSDFQDGQTLPPGGTLALVKAPPQALLMGERTALNFLRHLCAIATLTARFVKIVQGTNLRILDTRKTTPGLRHLEKYAVTCGGGINHRQGLYDAVMIKNNHVDLLGGMENALVKLPDLKKGKIPVIVEARSIGEVETILKWGEKKISRVLLDNMSLATLRQSVALCSGHLETEASGGITLENIRAIAETGVDFASIGMLTHSAGNVDLAMRLERRG